ncbi:hypothetical protein VNO77_29472 [Canavalia gladiata]|uniref:Uncharacterized protein n=1 Tax=Canavalia gladiata TaxID=3824 RepID=A0AAN9KZJ3_CANGL
MFGSFPFFWFFNYGILSGCSLAWVGTLGVGLFCVSTVSLLLELRKLEAGRIQNKCEFSYADTRETDNAHQIQREPLRGAAEFGIEWLALSSSLRRREGMDENRNLHAIEALAITTNDFAPPGEEKGDAIDGVPLRMSLCMMHCRSSTSAPVMKFSKLGQLSRGSSQTASVLRTMTK